MQYIPLSSSGLNPALKFIFCTTFHRSQHSCYMSPINRLTHINLCTGPAYPRNNGVHRYGFKLSTFPKRPKLLWRIEPLYHVVLLIPLLIYIHIHCEDDTVLNSSGDNPVTGGFPSFRRSMDDILDEQVSSSSLCMKTIYQYPAGSWMNIIQRENKTYVTLY
jgi:hypothetical protein